MVRIILTMNNKITLAFCNLERAHNSTKPIEGIRIGKKSNRYLPIGESPPCQKLKVISIIIVGANTNMILTNEVRLILNHMGRPTAINTKTGQFTRIPRDASNNRAEIICGAEALRLTFEYIFEGFQTPNQLCVEYIKSNKIGSSINRMPSGSLQFFFQILYVAKAKIGSAMARVLK